MREENARDLLGGVDGGRRGALGEWPVGESVDERRGGSAALWLELTLKSFQGGAGGVTREPGLEATNVGEDRRDALKYP